ncbi:hypothetical protein LJB93_02085, partial [Desulfovibrio sp. OttesenSCG-928-F07]|nr:hypothetical protein [Desulfovibrio sp. OttesenSCG-928-F07]
AMEAHSGQQSFQSYVKSHKEVLLVKFKQVTNWQDLHKSLAEFSIGVKPQGNGLVIYNLKGKQQIKASSLDRSVSKGKLEVKLGLYTAPIAKEIQEIKAQHEYTKHPLQREPNREDLYTKYQKAKKAKSKAYKQLNQLYEAEKQLKEPIIEKWNAHRQELNKNYKLNSKDRWGLIQQTYILQKDELDACAPLQQIEQDRKAQSQQIKVLYPFSTWNDFLRHHALQGNETALDVMRDKQVKEQALPRVNRSAQKDILANTNLKLKDKKKLLAVAKLEEKTGEQYKVTISPSGVMIIHLPTGGTLRDTGKEIYFSQFDQEAGKLARTYAHTRWGKMCQQKDNSFVLSTQKVKTLQR